MKPCGTAYFGVLLNLTTGRKDFSGPIGLRDLKEADDRMPMCPADAERGHVVLRRMTRNADCDLTHPVRALEWNFEETEQKYGEVTFICHDLPVSDHYYVV